MRNGLVIVHISEPSIPLNNRDYTYATTKQDPGKA